jgi:uncharacterized membrane protein
LEVTAAMAAANVAVLSPVPILTLLGTVTAALLLSSVMLAALVAAAVRVTVHVEVPALVTVATEQDKLFN